MENLKNVGLGSAAMDLNLGLGDVLAKQLEDEMDERKKKLLALQNKQPGQFGDSATSSVMGPATLSLFGPKAGATSALGIGGM
jgi:hypothetical protein